MSRRAQKYIKDDEKDDGTSDDETSSSLSEFSEEISDDNEFAAEYENTECNTCGGKKKLLDRKNRQKEKDNSGSDQTRMLVIDPNVGTTKKEQFVLAITVLMVRRAAATFDYADAMVLFSQTKNRPAQEQQVYLDHLFDIETRIGDAFQRRKLGTALRDESRQFSDFLTKLRFLILSKSRVATSDVEKWIESRVDFGNPPTFPFNAEKDTQISQKLASNPAALNAFRNLDAPIMGMFRSAEALAVLLSTYKKKALPLAANKQVLYEMARKRILMAFRLANREYADLISEQKIGDETERGTFYVDSANLGEKIAKALK